MRKLSLLLILGILAISTRSFGQIKLVSPEEGRRALENMPKSPAAPPPARHTAILPDNFAGWVAASKQVFGPYNAATLVGADAPVLVEYGYDGAERREYRQDGQLLRVDGFRMKDSSGSYGLYTFYRGEDWETAERGGVQIARHGGQLMLRKEEILVRASFEGRTDARLGDADARQLAARLGANGGGPLPTLPRNLPEKGLVRNSGKYIMGPAVFDRLVKNFPPVLVDFDMGAEAELARYESPGAPPVAFLLLSYPTPQMAAAKLKEWKESPPIAPDSPPVRLNARRVGPLLAFVLDPANQAGAERLLSGVSYHAEITWNERVQKTDDAQSWARLILNIFFLIGALLLFALITGLGFGLLRVLLQKRYPNRFFDRPEETEIIRLNINYSPKRT